MTDEEWDQLSEQRIADRRKWREEIMEHIATLRANPDRSVSNAALADILELVEKLTRQ